MRKLAVILILAAGAGLVYYLTRPEPAFDLDRFERQMTRLKAAYTLASKTADTDSTTEQIELDTEYLNDVRALLEGHDDDCAQTVQELEERHAEYLQELDELPERSTARDIQAMEKIRRMREAQRAVALLAPVWFELAPAVEDFAWACPEESAVLDEVLGSVEEGR